MPESIAYFPGANTARGFYSLYDSFADESAGDTVWYIKGGPGNGKSTFMRKVARAAEEKGLEVEYALCSGDPDSLDGVYIPALRLAYTDATSPHVQEPELPGSGGRYLDLSRFYRKNRLPDRERTAELFAAYRQEYAEAYGLFSAAENCGAAADSAAVDTVKLSELCAEILSREELLLPEGEGFAEKGRFISAYTCQGTIRLAGLPQKCGRIVAVTGGALVDRPLMERVLEACRERGCGAIRCPDPLTPEKTEAVLIPEAGLSFVSQRGHYTGKPWRRADLTPALRREETDGEHTDRKALAAMKRRMLSAGIGRLQKAKEYHDRLEELYSGAVDFIGINRLCDKHIRELDL